MHYGMIMIEFIRNVSTTIKKQYYSINNQTEEILTKEKSGLIFMTAHIGNWEMLIL